jgi:predicted transcriptional regulator
VGSVLISLKPRFAEAILEGTKRFEFRRVPFRRPGVDRAILYASSPVQRVVGEFSIGKILSEDPETLWLRTCAHAGIDKRFFDLYFTGVNLAFAISVRNPLRYAQHMDLKDALGLARPPQSFCYIPAQSAVLSVDQLR